ncbi:MAG: cadherin-like domain-containing protein, partial [Gammaproteobacteria bacterium]|nr:cadherin-like domain-containing protein [Gammaproteobacteria bacterium]
LSIVTEPQNGALLLSTDGSFNYTPQPNFSGSDSLVYQVLDPAGNKASATVSINVTPKNDAPIANDNYYILSANSLLTLSNNQGLFGNDSDIDGDSLKIATINGNQVNFDPNQTIATLSGSIQIYELGGFTYTPNENFEGTDSFTYQVTDGTLLSTSALVVLSVKNGVLETDNLTQLIIIDDLQNNDIDLTIIDANFSAEHGALSIENNQLVYTPSIEFGGTDLVTINYSYTTDEGQYNTHLEYIVNITKIDTEPLLVAESSLVVYENQVGATGFLATAVDVEGDDYTITWSDELGILTDHFINSSNSSDTLDIEIIKAFDFEELNNNFSANDLDESSDNNEFQLQFTVTATQDNNEEMHTNQIVKLTILDAEDAPEFTSESTFSVAENQQEGSLLFTVSAVDPDGQVISYDFDDAPNLFSINSDTGAVTLNSSSLDHETTPSYSFNIIATDSSGDSSTQIITLNIGDIDEAPEFLSNNTFFVSENTNVNSALFKVTAIDPERQNVNYSIQQGSNKFSIDSFNGIVTLNSEQLDYEDSDSYVLIVNAADSDGNSATQSIVINITNINEAPVFASGSIYTAPENTTVGSTLLTVGANDPESQTVTYSLSNDFNLFDINPSTGSITLSSAELDFETITSYILNVRATDILNKSSTKNITLNITDIDEAPSLLLNGSLSFDESQTGNTGYIVTAHDPEGDSYTITFTDNDELLTAYLSDIDSSTDTIEFSITSPVDYEMFNSMFAGLDADGDANNSVFEYHLTVKATQVDDPSLFEDYTLIVYIHDVVENTELYLDTNFANAGIASFSTYSDISSNDYLIDAVIDDSNNRFILVKSNDSYNFKDTYYVAKISQDGSFDLSFGINGRKQLAPSALNDGNIDDTNYTSLSGFTLKKLKISQPTDKVYLLGSQILSTGDTTETPIIVRLNSDGSLDNTFSSDGKYEVSVTTNDHSEAIDLLAIDNGTDYDLFLASNSTEDSSVTPASFKLIRMDTSGVEVESNSYNLSSSTTDYEYIKGMVANSNDDIFVFGDVENSSEAYDLLVAKLDKGNISSATVTSAQTGADLGVTTSGTTEMYTTIYIQSASDQLLVAGSITNSSELDAIIAKIDLSSFALDTSFNTNGYYTAGYIAGVNERVTGLAVDSNDNITFVTQTGYFSGQIQLIPSQLDTSGVVTTLGVSLAAEELTNTLGAGITTTSNIQARILHESGDDNLYVFSNFEKTNENSSTEIEIYYEKVDVNALPPDLAEKSNRIDYEFLTYDSSQVHDAIVHSSGKVLTSTDRYSDFNNYDYGYTLTAHDENSGEWLQTFSDSQYPGYIHQDSDSVNNLYLEALKFVELSDGSIIYLQLEEESSSSTTSLIVHKYDSNGNVVSGFPVSNTLAMQVSINEVIYNEMVEKVAIIGTSNVEIGDAYALMFSPSNGSVDYEFAPTQLFGVDATFGDPYANTLTAGIIRDDGTLIAIGNADTDTVSNTFMLKLSTSGLTDSSFGTVTSSGDYALTVTSEVEPIKLAELSDNSLVLLGYHTSDFEFGLYKFDVSGDSYVLNSNYNSDINYDYMPIDASTMISNINDTSYDNEVKDMVVDDSDRITFAGSLYVYARGDYGFIARFNGADGSVDTTLGNQTYPGYWMPAGVEDCQNQTSNTYIDVCDITSFEQLNVTSDGAIILHGIASAPDNYQHTVILKFIESQNDTAPASYSLIGDVIGGA